MKAPAFQLYAADFYMDTVDWTPTEVGVYFRLLMSEWVNGPLQDDTKRLARISGIDHGNFVKLWGPPPGGDMGKKFVRNGNGTLYNRRLEEVRLNQQNYSESRRKNISNRYKDKATHEEHMNLHSSYIGSALQSSSSSSSLNKEKNKRLKHIAKVEKTPSPDVKQFIDFYYEEFKKAFSTPPHIQGGKDGAITKRLLSRIPFEELKKLLLRYFDSTDSFILKSGYTISVFESQINKLKIGEGAKDGMDLWLKVKEAQDERRG